MCWRDFLSAKFFCEFWNNRLWKKQPSFAVETVYQKTSEAVVKGCFVKKVFLIISQNSQENASVRVSF